MSLTVEESEEGLCFSSRIRYQERAEITKSKMITCPDIDDYLAPYKQPIMTWNKECQRQDWRSSIIINTTSLWIPEVQEDDGGNYTCELKYGSRVVRRTTELKVTGTLSNQFKYNTVFGAHRKQIVPVIINSRFFPAGPNRSCCLTAPFRADPA
ncbi:hypothetical protein PO909_006584 [Leuciscus waleckii]